MTGLPTVTLELELSAGVWTNVTAYWYSYAETTISRGRSSKSDDGQPGVFSCTLDNSDGRFTPDNPTGAYWPSFDSGIRLRYKAGGVTRFLGWVNRIEPIFAGADGGISTVSLTAYDSLGLLARTPMRSMYEHEVLADAPLWYFPLTEPKGASRFRSIAAATMTADVELFDITVTPVVYSLEIGGSTGPIEGLPSPKFSPESGGRASGYYLEAHKLTTTGTESLLELWVQPARTAAQLFTEAAEMWALWLNYYDGSATQGEITIYESVYGYPTVAVTSAAAGSTTLLDSHPLEVDTWNQLALHQSVSGTTNTLTLYVNGAASMSTTLVGGATVVPVERIVVGQAYNADFWDGSVAHVSYTVGTGLAARVSERYRAATTGIVESSSARVARIASYFGLTTSGSGGKSQGAQRTSGRKALDAVLEVARGDSGIVYDDAGTLTGRWTGVHPATVSVTLDAEHDLDGSPLWTKSTTERAASVTATSESGGQALALDPTSPTDATRSVETALATLDALQAVATREIVYSRDAVLRPASAAVDLVTAGNAISASMLSLKLGDRVRISGLPSSLLGRTYADGYALGYTERVSASRYVIELDLEAADAPSDATADDANRGRAMAGGTMTLTSGITSSGTSVSITTSSGPTLTTSAGAYPLDLDIEGERVTVASAPASAVSPQTVTVTRGVAPSVARAHSAGAAIDVYLGARAAY